jgi:formylglycine-generating enzyme required for sulfatase activity
LRAGGRCGEIVGLRDRVAIVLAVGVGTALVGCGTTHPRLSHTDPASLGVPAPPVHWNGTPAPLSRAADGMLVLVPAGRSVAGSTPEERTTAYDEYLATSGHDAARDGTWFEREDDRHIVWIDSYRIDAMPVTNAAYAEMVADGAARPPAIDAAGWARQGFEQDFTRDVQRFLWQGDRPPPGREDHPVVLVTWAEAAAYCAWRGAVVGERRRLPTAFEFEKAARGTDGRAYPWGAIFDASKLDSALGGPRDTVAVGSYPDGASPFGVLDVAGNVFQWTATPWPPGTQAGPEPTAEMTVKGSGWDDYAGVGRGAAWHGRPRDTRHIIIGFRCAADAGD